MKLIRGNCGCGKKRLRVLRVVAQCEKCGRKHIIQIKTEQTIIGGGSI